MSDTGEGQAVAGQGAFLLAQLGSLAAGRFAERITALGLTPPHAGLLRVVTAEPGLSQQEVSRKLGLLPSRLVALVDDLEGGGLLERRRNPRDRRQYGLYLTPAGHEQVAGLGRAARAHGEDLLEPLTLADRATLGRLLTQLADAHGLTPGVHPGYRDLGPKPKKTAQSS